MPKVAERLDARERLLGWLQPGDTVYTILRHVSRSGMQRVIGVVVFLGDDVKPIHPIHPNYAVANLLGRRLSKDYDGVVCGGTGMDMGFELVYSLSSALFPDGFECIGEGCPANDHVNGVREYGAGVFHRDGGYALRQAWL